MPPSTSGISTQSTMCLSLFCLILKTWLVANLKFSGRISVGRRLPVSLKRKAYLRSSSKNKLTLTQVTVYWHRAVKSYTEWPRYLKPKKIGLVSSLASQRLTSLARTTLEPSSTLAILMMLQLGRWRDTSHGVNKASWSGWSRSLTLILLMQQSSLICLINQLSAWEEPHVLLETKRTTS